jgi:hypothetical protein
MICNAYRLPIFSLAIQIGILRLVVHECGELSHGTLYRNQSICLPLAIHFQNDLQAMARAHRIGQTRAVRYEQICNMYDTVR